MDKQFFETEKSNAIAWAKWALEQEALIIDTETTGVDNEAEIIQLAIVDLQGKIIFQSRFKPEIPINPGATMAHGIKDDDLLEEPLFSECYPKIKAALEGRVVVAYNLEFDDRLLRQTCKRYALSEIEYKTGCAMEAFAAFYGDWNDWHNSFKWQKLQTAAYHFNFAIEGAHDAAADALATVKVIKAMAK